MKYFGYLVLVLILATSLGILLNTSSDTEKVINKEFSPSGGTYLHISDRPLRIRKANLSIEMEDTRKSVK